MCRFATVCLFLICLASLAHASPAMRPLFAAPPDDDWNVRVRALLNAGSVQAALELTEKWMAEAPKDMDAVGWHGRALARMGRLPEAEADFRRMLASAPNDSDALLDLAGVLRRQGHPEDALERLKQAHAADPRRVDVLLEEGRVLLALGRTREAREAFEEARSLAPGDAEVREGLASLAAPEAPLHEFHVGTDIDMFNYTNSAGAFNTGLKTDWTAQWITYFEVSYWDRFGGHAERNLGQVTFKPRAHTAITAGATWNHDDGVIPRSEAFFEFDQGGSIPGHHFVRGLEFNYHQQWYWFSTARVLALTPSVIAYLPRDWMFQFGITAARSSFPGLPPGWQPSGQTKLTFPIRPRLTGNIFFAVGSEDFALTDQIGRFAARTWGGGLRWEFERRQYVSGYGFYQDRSQARSQTSFGLTYGVRF
ncbi:MAG TPA: tetratricopeptide repeat protein [Candidatus Acidoferrales bacterium]|nr:tetratricopeptide repeat protein [Candidatus Acidoferrales bacterium]